MVESPVIPSVAVSYHGNAGPINLDLQGLNSLEILDKIVAYSAEIGLRVILDNHRSEAGNSAEASGLWYTDYYTEARWITDWQFLTRRYLNNPTVIGMDVRNEPHNASSGGSCWDCGLPEHDWHRAAERAGNAILAINPKLLIFVEGTDSYNNDFTWWGGNLEGVARSPVLLSVPHQLVYSAHEYGPAEYAQSWFNPGTTYTSLSTQWRKHWAFISERNLAPVWLGEFGTGDDETDVVGSNPGSQGQYFQSLIRFLKANPRLSWTYWALNGNDADGLLDQQYDPGPVSADKKQALASIEFPLSSNPSSAPAAAANLAGSQPLPSPGAPTATASSPAVTAKSTSEVTASHSVAKRTAVSCHVAYLKPTDWNNGFTGSLTIYNNSSTSLRGWSLSWTWSGNQRITRSWNSTYAQTGPAVILHNVTHNEILPGNSNVVEVGFNASYSGANSNPSAFFLNSSRCE